MGRWRVFGWPASAGLVCARRVETRGGFEPFEVDQAEGVTSGIRKTEALRTFVEKLGPIMKEIGIDAQPEVYPAYAFVCA